MPKAWLVEAVNEVITRFGAASFERHSVEGHWRSKAKLFRDVLSRLIIDMPDTLRNRQILMIEDNGGRITVLRVC